MSERTVAYRFTGDFKNLTAGLAASGKSVSDLGVKLTALDKNGAKMRAGLTSIGSAAGKMGLVAGAGVAVMIGAAAHFDKAMSSVAAATHETAANMELLRAAAIKAGAATKFSATEAAGGIEALAKAGISTKDILAGGLTGALDLAAAGSLDVAQAAEIAATAMTQFSLAGDQTPHVADLLAAAAGKAQGEVTDMAASLQYVGPVAAQMGISIEQTTGAIAELASQGILGSQAGTALRGMLTSLTSPSKAAQAQMDALGLSMYDAQGKFVGLDGIAGQLNASLKDEEAATRDAALGRIFGNEQITAARILYEGGSGAVQDWTDKVNDSGYAAETAAIKMDNLAGDFEKLKGSLETALIGAGSGSQGPLRSLVQNVDKVVNAFNDAPPAVQGVTTKLLGLTAVTGGAAWFGSKVITGIAATKTALSQLGVTAVTTTRLMAGISAGANFAAIAGGVWLLDKALDAAFGKRELDGGELTRNLTALADGRVSGNLDQIGANLRDINSSLAHAEAQVPMPFVDDRWDIAADNIGKVDEALASMVEGGEGEKAAAVMDQIVKMAAKEGVSLQEATKWFDQYNLALDNLGGTSVVKILDDVTGGVLTAALATKGLTASTKGYGNAVNKAKIEAKQQAEELRKSREAATTTASAFFGLGKGLDNAKLSLKGWLNQLENQADALRNFRLNAEQAADKGLRQGLIKALQEAGPEGAMRMKQLANATDTEIARANRAWKRGQDEIKRYTNAIGGVPPAVTTNVNLKGIPTAMQQLRSVQSALNAIHDKTIHVDIVRGSDAGIPYVSGGTRHPADGETIPGPRHPYGDKIPALLAPGEEVVSNRFGQADRNRSLLKAINANRMAGGGTAGLSTYSRSTSSTTADALDKVTDAAHKTRVAFEWVSGGLVAELKVRQKLLEHEVDRDKQRLDMLKQERQSLADSIAARFADSPFGQQNGSMPELANTAGMSPEERAQALATYNQQFAAYQQANSPTAILQQQLADAREMRDLLKQLQRMGLSGPALAQVATTASLEEMRALLAGGRGGISQYEHLLGAVGHVSSQLGNSIGNDVYGAQIKDQTKELRETKEALHRMEGQLKELTGIKHATQHVGHDVAAALDRAGGNASRRNGR